MVNYLPPYQTELIEESEQTDYLIQEEKDGQNDSAADHHTHPLRPLRDAPGQPHPRTFLQSSRPHQKFWVQ